jgi:hypothetical protein
MRDAFTYCGYCNGNGHFGAQREHCHVCGGSGFVPMEGDHRIIGPEDITALRAILTFMKDTDLGDWIQTAQINRLAALIGDDK